MPAIHIPADPDRAMAEASAGARLSLIADSFASLTGRPLPAAADGDLWTAPCAVVAHGTQADPVFFYGNRLALDLFELPAADFVALPSRFSAEPLERDARARLLAQVNAHGFIDDYAGVRVSATGRRFRIEGATVWNLIDHRGDLHGQAAMFDRWVRLN
jgi:hypothetical protein